MTIKALLEKKEDLKAKMKEIVDAAKAENRELTEDEVKNFDETEKSIKDIEKTIERMEKVENLEVKTPKVEDRQELTQEEKDIKAFAGYIRAIAGKVQNDATQLTKGDNGAVIPKTIVQKIIEKVEDICPIYKLATKYPIGGTISIPKEDESSDAITVAYATEFTDLTSHSGKTGSIELTGYLYGALTKISKSLLKNSDFKLTEYVITKMSKKIAKFLEGELLNGTTNKVSGVIGSYDSTNMKVVLGAKSSITADELIDVQELVPDVYATEAIWVMNKATRKSIRKLKDGQGNYLLEKDSTARWNYKLLGNDVYCTDNLKALGTASKPVVMFGDFSGLAVKESEQSEIQILNELYAAQHAIGVVAWGEIDAKVEDTQKIAVAVTGATDPAAKE